MPSLPSFRPRAALGVLQRDGTVSPSPEFLRWLDLVTRQAEDTGGFVETQELSPIAMPSQPIATGLSPNFHPVPAPRDLSPILRTCDPQNGLAPL